MKHNSVSRMVLAALLVAASHVFGATKTVTWTLPADWEANVEYGENNGRFAVNGPDFGYPTEPIGAPALPFLPVSIAVPSGATYSNCTVEATWATVDTKLRPSVIQEPHIVGADPIETPEDPQYFGAACYPSAPNDLMTVMTIDGKTMLTARITPYRWNGQKGVLEKAVLLKVIFTCVTPRATLKLATAAAAEKVDFVIVSPSAYVTWWEEYAAYRRSTHTNLTFLVKNADEIYADYEGHDDALKIHHYLEHMYANCGTKYVLLGAGCPKGTEAYDSTSMIQLRMTASCNQLYFPSDMYYACMERKNNVGEVWDPNSDGVYLGSKKSGGGYSSDGYYTIDWTPELSVFRFPARKVATLNKTSYTAQQQIQGFIEKLKRVEAADFAGNLRTGLTGYKVFAQKGHGDTSNYMTQERTFYDGMGNIFSSSHQNPTFDWEYDTRSVHYNYMLAYRPESAGVYHATTTPEAATFGTQNMEAFLHSSHGAPGGAVPLANLNFWTTKAIQKISFMCESCLTGKIDEADKITLPEAQLLNPNGGAVVSFNNTREGYGWANSFDSLSSKMKLSILMGFFSAKEDTSNTAAEAFAYGQRRYLPTIGGGSGNVGAACYLEVIAFGDPLVTLSKVTDCTDLPATVSSAFYRYATTTNKTLQANARSAVTKLTVNSLGNETFVVSGQDFRAFKGMAIYGGGNLKWDAPGGIGGAGLAFEKPGDLEISATGTTYFGPIFSNISNVLVSGKNATLDFDKTGKTRTLASLAFTGAGPNYIRSREGGIFPADFTIPVTGGTLVLQTQNIGGGGAAEHPDIPMFALTNATLQIAENPNWGTEFLNRAVWMTSSTIYSGYQSFGFGSSNASANGIDIHALGGDNYISGWADAEVNGELRAHVSEGASLNVNIALVKSSKSGSIRKLGAGTMTINGSLGKNATIAGGITVSEGRLVAAGSTAEAALGTGAVTVEDGGELELTTIPLTTITKLTVKKGGKLYLPGATGTATYRLVDPLKSALTIEEGALVYNIDDPTTPIPGTATGDGYYMDASGFINWKGGDGTWKNDVSVRNWETVSGVTTGYVDGASVQFKDCENADVLNVGVSGMLAPSYLNFVNARTAYNFTNETPDASITIGTLNTTGDVVFEPELSVAGKTIIGSGKATVGKIGTASATVLGGSALRVKGVLNPQTMISQVQLNVTKTYENYTTIYIPGTSLIVSQGIDCRGWSIHEFQLYDANGDLMALPEGTMVSGSSSNCGGSSEGYRSGSFTVTSSSAGKVNSYSGSPNGLQHVFDGSATGNYWGYAKSDSKQSTDGFKPQFSITITFPSPVKMISGYRIGSADNAKRQIEAWNVKVTEAISEGVYTVSSTNMSNGAINSWWPSATGKYATKYSGTTGAGELNVAEGAKLYLDGEMNVMPTLAAGAILAVTNTECMTVNKGFTMSGDVAVDVSEADKVGWTKVLSGAALGVRDISRFILSADDSAAKIKDGDLFIATEGVKKGPYTRMVDAAEWDWDSDAWKANGTDFGAKWSSVITRMADDVRVVADTSSTGTLDCDVSASTIFFTNRTDSVQSVAILGGGTVICNMLDVSGLRGSVIWEPDLNGANVNVGTNTVFLKNGSGGILTAVSGAYVSTVGTFSTYDITKDTRLHFAGSPRALNMSQLPSCGVLSFEDMTLNSGTAGAFQQPDITYLVEDGQSLTLTDATGYNARLTGSFDIRGGEMTINPNGAWWFGENGLSSYGQTGGKVICNATGTAAQSSADGIVIGYQGEGSYIIDMNISGGQFLAGNAIVNFWNPGTITLSSNGLMRVKGIAARSEITASLNVEEGGTLEIGSVGLTATPVNYNLYGGTFAAYENVTIETPFNLAGYGTLAATNGTTLTVKGGIVADGATLNVGVKGRYEGTVKMAAIPSGITNVVVSAGTLNLGTYRPVTKTLAVSGGAIAITLSNAQIMDAQTNAVRIIKAAAVPQGGVLVYNKRGHLQDGTVVEIVGGYLTVRTTHGNMFKTETGLKWGNIGDADNRVATKADQAGFTGKTWTLNLTNTANMCASTIGPNGRFAVTSMRFFGRKNNDKTAPTKVTLAQGSRTVVSTSARNTAAGGTLYVTGGSSQAYGLNEFTFDGTVDFDPSQNITMTFEPSGSEIGYGMMLPANTLFYHTFSSGDFSPIVEITGDWTYESDEPAVDDVGGDSVSINVIGGNNGLSGKSITSSNYAGVVPIKGANWNQTVTKTDKSAVSESKSNLLEVLADGSTINGPMTATFTAACAYVANNSTPSGGDAEMMYGYLDDGQTSGDYGATIKVENIPYTTYDVYVYMGTDQKDSGKKFAPVTIVGGNKTEQYPTTTTGWGDALSARGTVTLCETNNYLKFTGISGGTMTVKGAKNGSVSNARCGIAGIQIVNTGVRQEIYTWEGGDEGAWSENAANWLSPEGASVVWPCAGENLVARFTNDASVRIEGEVVAPTVKFEIPDETRTFDGYVPTTSTKLFEGVKLSDIVSFAGQLAGGWVANGAASVYHISRTGSLATMQFQKSDDGYVKCAKLELTQNGADIYGRVLWSKHNNKSGTIGMDFESVTTTAQTPVSDDGNGYGIKGLTISVKQKGTLTLENADGIAGTLTVANGKLAIASGEMTADLSLGADAVLDISSSSSGNIVITSGTLTGVLSDLSNVAVNGAAVSTADYALVGGVLKDLRVTAGPTIPDGSGEIAVNPTNAAEYVISTNNVQPQITIVGAGDHTIVVPLAVTSVVGVATEKIKVRHGDYDITAAFTKTGDAAAGVVLRLDAEATVEIGAESIPVRPQLSTVEGDDHVADAPFAVSGENAAVGVKSIPGLTYKLMRGNEIGTYGHEAAAETAKGPRVKLQDSQKPDGKAFYVITVGAGIR